MSWKSLGSVVEVIGECRRGHWGMWYEVIGECRGSHWGMRMKSLGSVVEVIGECCMKSLKCHWRTWKIILSDESKSLYTLAMHD